MAVPQIPIRWICFCFMSATRRTHAGSGCTAASIFKATFVSDAERRPHTQWQREILAGNVAGLQPKRDRHPQVAQNAHHNIAEACSPSASALPQSRISPKIIPRTPSNFPASFNCISMRSIRYGGSLQVLQEENRIRGVDLVRRPQRGAQQRETAAIENTLRPSLHQRLHFVRLKLALVGSCRMRPPPTRPPRQRRRGGQNLPPPWARGR